VDGLGRRVAGRGGVFVIGGAFVTFAASSLLDEDGRPVAEVGSPLYEGVATEIVACPYHDARRGLPMNRSALRQLGAAWPSVVATARALAGPSPTVHAAWCAAVVGLAAPVVWHHQRGGAPVPRALSASFKTSLGMSQVLTALLLSDAAMAGAPLGSLGSRDDFLAVLDQGRWLVGQDQVCAGAPGQIGELFDALCGFEGDAALDPALRLLAPLAPWRDEAALAIARSVGWLATLAARQRGGARAPGGARGAAWLAGDVPPWLRAVLAVPNRPPEHALRLYPAGEAPAALVAFLASVPEQLDA
jgi:hypothetical protein